jgi:hypothetical protein
VIEELRSACKKLALILLGAVTVIPFTAFLLLNRQKVSLFLDITPPERGTHTPDIIAPLGEVVLCVFLLGAMIGAVGAHLYSSGFQFPNKK